MKTFLAAIVLTVLFAVPSYALSFQGAGLGAGVYVPMGDASDYLDMGYSVNGNVDFGIIPMFDLRLFADYYKADGDKDGYDYDYSSTGGGAMLMFYPDIPLFNVYAGLGYALYRNTIEITGNGRSDTDDYWGHGPKAQAGFTFNVLFVNLGLHASYFLNTTSKDEMEDMSGFNVGLAAGLRF